MLVQVGARNLGVGGVEAVGTTVGLALGVERYRVEPDYLTLFVGEADCPD
jgi:hypothetical protein